MKLERVTCVIDRAAHLKIEKEVPSWEVRVLAAIFDGPNVTVTKTETYEGNFDADKEWASMFNRYKSAQDEHAKSIFLKVYPNADVLDQAFERMTAKASTPKRVRESASVAA
jgi:predicted SnoaL-like aldol condensation-catalyzing enzyme